MADNIDLPLIINDFEAYHELRLGKKPKLVRKLRDDEEPRARPPVKPQETSKRSVSRVSNSKQTTKSTENSKLINANGPTTEDSDDISINLAIQGSSVSGGRLQDDRADNGDVDRIENRFGRQFFIPLVFAY